MSTARGITEVPEDFMASPPHIQQVTATDPDEAATPHEASEDTQTMPYTAQNMDLKVFLKAIQ